MILDSFDILATSVVARRAAWAALILVFVVGIVTRAEASFVKIIFSPEACPPENAIIVVVNNDLVLPLHDLALVASSGRGDSYIIAKISDSDDDRREGTHHGGNNIDPVRGHEIANGFQRRSEDENVKTGATVVIIVLAALIFFGLLAHYTRCNR